MNLVSAKLLCENERSYIDQLIVNFAQILIKAKTFMRGMIETRV